MSLVKRAGFCASAASTSGERSSMRPREGGELDLGDEIHAAGHRTQRVGQALLFPAIGFAIFSVEKIQCSDEVGVKPVLSFDVDRLHVFFLRIDRRAYGREIVTRQ